MEKIRAKGVLATIMLLSLMGTAGIALPYPLLSPYFLNSSGEPLTQFLALDPKLLLGITLATYPLGLLFGSNIIGSLSDRFGRKKVLLYSLAGSVLGYLLTGFAVYKGSFTAFIFARFLTGFCEGNMSIARAIAVELHPVIDRKKALSLLYAAVYGGWLIGPLAGGYLAPLGVEAAFYAAGAAVLFSTLLVILVLPQTPVQKLSQSTLWQEIIQNHSATLLLRKDIRQFFVYYFLYTLGINAFYEFYPLWLADIQEFGSKQIAWMTVAITSLMILVSTTIADKLPTKLGEKRALLGGNFIFALLIVTSTLSSGNSVYIFLALTGAVIAVINMVFPAMLSEYFGHLGQGKVMGLQMSVFCFTNVIIALAGSLVAIISTTLTMWLAAALILVSVFFFVQPEREEQPENALVATENSY
ncbi:MFS transporter [Aliikangiella sp. G2MR2-5]|uniref:MFS transporter n=1 Tax=Aliikangiella sp. G2MR2-5 TaxID=2788943 RepID=UPI0018AA8F2F|nr:MFS transporter [Aliikangiella sp. G2MR2-5]